MIFQLDPKDGHHVKGKLKPFTPKFKKVHSPNHFEEKCICDVVRTGSIIIFHLSKL